MSDSTPILKSVGHRRWNHFWQTGYRAHESILYFGRWKRVSGDGVNAARSNTQYNAFEFSFRGPVVQWMGSRGPDQGVADVYVDGEFCQSVDAYSGTLESDVLKFEKNDLRDHRVHTLRVVVRKERNPQATDCYQDVTTLRAVEPVVYPLEISNAMSAEYGKIQDGTKEYRAPGSWKPVANRADSPATGVTLNSGPLLDVFLRNIDYLNHSFATPGYCDGGGWSDAYPASNEGRLLAGAGNSLRWAERDDMRTIVDTLVERIESQMRNDGYYNYYEEADSYALDAGAKSERKNYDRVFWTRGLLAAGMAGNPKAYGLVRRMYDWFNSSHYLPRVLVGSNATNGLPGGPLVYLSPAGRDEDLIVTQRYYDQHYWMAELVNREPLCLSHYPGERPHCYELLGFEAFLDEYRATAAQEYLDAVIGGWDIYRENYKHIGGATAIMESTELFPPKSYYFVDGGIGETCGSVFWINLNSKLLQLFPDEEKYAAEIEETMFNVTLANQDEKGYIRFYTNLEGTKSDARCHNSCCEVSYAGLLARLPEFVYSIAPDGIYLNLYTSSSIRWESDGDEITLTTETQFPVDTVVSVRLSMATTKPMTIHLRVPSWAAGNVSFSVNGEKGASGVPGSYAVLHREWSDNDTIKFSLPIEFRVEQYPGLDQIEGNLDRYALLYGPVLMALVGELADSGEVPRIPVSAKQLPGLLRRTEANSLDYSIQGHPEYAYIPYWELQDETFTCFPVVEPEQE